MTRIIPAMAGLAILSLPALALAQESTTVTVSAEVAEACVLGDPAATQLAITDLTDDANGRLDAALTGTTPVLTTTIANAWCNYPSTLTIDASPLSLQNPPAWPSPANFSRHVTYSATVSGWSSVLVDRPLNGDAAKEVVATSAHAAPSTGLEIAISDLETLNGVGTAENAGMVLEAGAYAGQIVLTLSLNN